MLSVILVILGAVMHLAVKHPAGGITRLGLDVVVAGIAFGLIVLVVFVATRGRAPGRSPGSSAGADRGKSAGRQPLAAASGGSRSARPHVMNPTTVYSPGGLFDAPGDTRGPASPAGHGAPGGPGTARG